MSLCVKNLHSPVNGIFHTLQATIGVNLFPHKIFERGQFVNFPLCQSFISPKKLSSDGIITTNNVSFADFKGASGRDAVTTPVISAVPSLVVALLATRGGSAQPDRNTPGGSFYDGKNIYRRAGSRKTAFRARMFSRISFPC